MTDETPAAPRRRTRRRADTPEPTQDVLVGVMADTEVEPAQAPEPAAPAKPGAPAPEAADTAVEEAPPTVFRLERGGIAEATAGNVEVRLGGIGRLDAEEVFVQWGGVGAARADKLGVEFGSVGAGLAGELKVTQGIAGSVLARDATLEQSFVRTLIAQRVSVNRPTGVLVMIAQHVSGEVRPLLDWRGALVAGLAFGLVSVVARALRGGR